MLGAALRVAGRAGIVRLPVSVLRVCRVAAAAYSVVPALVPQSDDARSGKAAARSVVVASARDEPLVSQPAAPVQQFDFTLLAACVAEASRWLPAKVIGVTQSDGQTCVLRLRTLEKSCYLYICWSPTTARLCISELGPDAEEAAPRRGPRLSFGEAAADVLEGLALEAISLAAPWERVARLSFVERLGMPPSVLLFAEIQGRQSNVIVADAVTRAVMCCALQTGVKQTAVRPISIGGPYMAPPVAPGADPTPDDDVNAWRERVLAAAGPQSTPPESRIHDPTSKSSESRSHRLRAVAGRVETGLTRAYRGVGPGLARELAAAAGIAPGTVAESMLPSEWDALWVAWRRWINAVRSSRFGATVGPDGALSALGDDPLSSVCAAVDALYRPAHRGERFAATRRQLLACVTSEAKRARSKAVGFRAAVAAAGGASDQRATAELLLAHLDLCLPRAAEVTLPDWDEAAPPVTIALDPAKTALACAQTYFKRAGKLERSLSAVTPLLAEAESEADYLAQVLTGLEMMPLNSPTPGDNIALEAVRVELVEAGYLQAAGFAALKAGGGGATLTARGAAARAAGRGKTAKVARPVAPKGQKAAPAPGKAAAASAVAADASSVRRFVSPGGLEVIVGRNNRGNEAVSHKLARAGDLWMHVAGAPGCHCLLRAPAGGASFSFPPACVQFSADLAAYFSSLRGSTSVLVTLVDPKFVRKARGGRLGMVSVEEGRERSAWGRPGDSAAAKQ